MAATLPPASSSSSQQTITTRLHISGLSPTLCSLQDLTNRFTPYASVLSISHWPPTNDALGQPHNWAFVTLNGSRDKIRKCVNTLSGTVWKGSKVRIGEAKKDFKGGFGEGSEQVEGWARLNEDKIKAPAEGQDGCEDGEGEEKKKKKRKRRIANGREEQRVSRGQIITEEDVKAGKVWGWRITPAGHLIRPLQMRPTHPLPIATAPTPSASASASKTKRRKKAKEPAAPKSATISRAKNQLIDPARYGAIHLSGETLEEAANGQDTMAGTGELWVCEEVEGEEGKVRWVRSGGEQVEEVRTAGYKAVPQESLAPLQQEVEQRSEVSSSSSSSSSSASTSSESTSDSDSDSSSESNSDSDSHVDMSKPIKAVSAAQPSIAEPLFSAQPVAVGNDVTEDADSSDDDDDDDDDDGGDDDNNDEDVADGTFQLSHYDPQEDDAFSEGYNEDALPATAAVRQTIPLAEKTPQEKERELKLLKEMFGSSGLVKVDGAKAESKKAKAQKKAAMQQPVDEDDDEEEEGEWWKQLKGDGDTDVVEVVSQTDSDEAGDQQQTSAVQVDEPESAAQTSSPSPPSPPPPAQQKGKDLPTSAPPVLSKRAALLAQMKATSASTSTPAAVKPFQPVQRYEPASVPVPSTGDDTEAPQQSSIASIASASSSAVPTSATTATAPASAIIAAAGPSEVKMGSLKDMFKPQAGGGASSFSLFGSGAAGTATGWGIGEDELDEDFDFGFDDGEEEQGAASNASGGQAQSSVSGEGVRARMWGQRTSAEGAGQAGSTNSQLPSSGPPPFFFPRFDNDPRDPVTLLQRPPSHSHSHSHSSNSSNAPLQPFWRTESPADLEALWASRKVELTQDYKRRHREAVKKKRRRVTGSRRAGEGMGVGVASRRLK
ncbi:hypothetical protein BCV69DRAFT_313974 [Microstroma glucosiphilum]|uniref:RRM domain-containing protein n=1 Tax=Pseudomicrostroma glucosiphilum TaxID=1684307 RepID=A0A316U1Z3_9BASI|nr:hypothetical protein BCV69DRAFT_313974 [Pseudomicrostroma glucosiphilum]PWN19230.1 hypothetical protein BCV69DRAFT_313974 [Pseudomicrostroma glucosiphilum]